MIATQIPVRMEESVQIMVKTISLANAQQDSQAKTAIWILMIAIRILAKMEEFAQIMVETIILANAQQDLLAKTAKTFKFALRIPAKMEEFVLVRGITGGGIGSGCGAGVIAVNARKDFSEKIAKKQVY